MEAHRSRIAVINDNPDFLGLLEEALEDHGPYDVSTFRDVETSIDELRRARPDLLIIDVLTDQLPTGWEIAVVAGADQVLGPIPILVCSPMVKQLEHRIAELRRIANVRVLAKPFTLRELREAVAAAIGRPPVAGEE